MVNYQIEGMTCTHCKKTVEKIFADNGRQATADVDSKIVSVNETLKEEELETLRIRLSEDGYTLGNLK
ncbi:heavy-metal-associated domain-containing protein [Leptospira sp. WS39.C2]